MEVAQNASEFYRSQGQTERAALLRFIMPDSSLQGDRVILAFKPAFDIIHRMAPETKKAASVPEAACPTLLPLLDELRTYCYEHTIEEIPAFLTA